MKTPKNKVDDNVEDILPLNLETRRKKRGHPNYLNKKLNVTSKEYSIIKQQLC